MMVKHGATESQLQMAALIMQPLVLYVLAALCWSWIADAEGKADWALVIYSAGLAVLAYHWWRNGRALSAARKVVAFISPAILGFAGIAVMGVLK